MSIAGEAAQRALTRLSTFHGSDTLADFEIVCREHSWKVHRFALALHSEDLLHACGGSVKGAKVERLDLSAHLSDVVDRFVHFIYTMTYADGDHETSFESAQLEIQMCALADYYDIPPLKMLAVEKFRRCTAYWTTGFVSTCIEGVVKLINLACEGHAATVDVREAIIYKIVDLNVLSKSDVIARKLVEVMGKYPDFAVQLLQRSAACRESGPTEAEATQVVKYKCRFCRKEFVNNEWCLIHHCPGCDVLMTPREWSECVI